MSIILQNVFLIILYYMTVILYITVIIILLFLYLFMILEFIELTNREWVHLTIRYN